MSEDRDPYLQSLFTEYEPLDHEDFVMQVRQRIREQEIRRWLILALAGTILIGILWLLSEPLYVFGMSLTLYLTVPIIDLGEGLVSLIFSPINNVASILILTGKLAWSMWKRIRRVSYV